MTIRNITHKDLDKVLKIYAAARKRMKDGGNFSQWKDSHPKRELILSDIENKTGYVLEEGGEILGVFAFILGNDPTYDYIEGEWKNDLPYGTIHRIARAEKGCGIFSKCLEFCFTLIDNIRIDTHADNKIMLHLLEKHGFERCGIIYVADKSPRIAFQKCLKK